MSNTDNLTAGLVDVRWLVKFNVDNTEKVSPWAPVVLWLVAEDDAFSVVVGYGVQYSKSGIGINFRSASSVSCLN